jgi:hydroxysqualene synthase
MSAYSLNDAYQYCQQLAQSHYENFPVASRLLPRRTRAVIYAFARQADDIADEGNADSAARLQQLARYTAGLEHIAKGDTPDDPVFIALADVIQHHHLPLGLFHDLLSAFRQDVTKKRYADFDEVLDYCRRSANPVGRLLLHLHDEATAQNLLLSDQICSALQLINFMQDLEQDYHENNRIYLPQDEMRQFGVTEEDIATQNSSHELQRLVDYQLDRIAKMMTDGAELGVYLRGLFGLEIRLIIQAGTTVIEKLAAHDGNVFSRPRLSKGDYLRIGWRALQRQRHPSVPVTPSSS